MQTSISTHIMVYTNVYKSKPIEPFQQHRGLCIQNSMANLAEEDAFYISKSHSDVKSTIGLLSIICRCVTILRERQARTVRSRSSISKVYIAWLLSRQTEKQWQVKKLHKFLGCRVRSVCTCSHRHRQNTLSLISQMVSTTTASILYKKLHYYKS